MALSICVFLCSCSYKDNGAEKLSEKLFSDYTADISFIASDKQNGTELCGTARVEKISDSQENRVVVDLLSPEEYNGITLECDFAGENQAISLVYSGIKTSLDNNIFSKIDVAMSLISDSIARNIENCKKENITKYPEKYALFGINDPEPYTMSFEDGDITYTVIYDKNSGTPFIMKAENQSFSITAKTEKIKYEIINK